MLNSRVIGSILLIVAMSIGGGLLSLPVVTAVSGFFNSTILMVITWLITTISSLFILEVCLWMPDGTNLISMARRTLGVPAQVFMWIFYIIMLYCIMCVYISGGTDMVRSLWQLLHINIAPWLSSLLFVLVFGTIVWHGIKLVDHTNRLLMTGKMALYLLLIIMLIPFAKTSQLPSGSLTALSGSVMPVFFAFGYSIVVPSLRSYLKSNAKQLRFAIIVGSLIPLLCFIIWNYTVQGIMSKTQLIDISHSGQVVSQLNAGLSVVGNTWVFTITRIFTMICILTAFLGVSLSLSDCMANSLNCTKQGKTKWLVYGLTFLPPLVIVLFQPYVFITAIRYAGILVVVISILLPTIMIWKGRYHSTLAQHAKYKVAGGMVTISVMLIISIILLTVAATHIA